MKAHRYVEIKWVALFALFFISDLLLINVFTFAISPINGEDYGLSRMIHGSTVCERLIWIVHRSWFQITHWNARLGEQLAIFWMEMPRVFFDVSFVLFYAIFIWIIARLASSRMVFRRTPEKSIIMMAISAIFVVLLWPRFEVFYWRTGFAEYMQPLVLNLTILMIFSTHKKIVDDIKAIYFPILTVAAFAAGLSFENVAPGIFAYMTLVIYYDSRKYKFLSKKMIVLASCYLAGWMLLVSAPSTRMREHIYSRMYGSAQHNLDYYIGRILDVISVFWNSSWPLVLALVISTLFVICIGRFKHLRAVYLLCVAAFISNAVLIFAPYTDARAFVFTWVVMSVCCLAVIDLILPKTGKWRLIVGGMFVLFGFIAIGEAIGIYSYYFDFNNEVTARSDYILSHVGSSQCKHGLPISLIPSAASPRALTNREIWVANSLNQVSAYFDCKLVLSNEK